MFQRSQRLWQRKNIWLERRSEVLRVGPALMAMVLAGSTILAQRQTIEQGTPAALKGVTTIVVNANKEFRTKIVKEIHRKLPQLTINSRTHRPEISLHFFVTRQANPNAAAPGDTSGSQDREYQSTGRGDVIKLGSRGGRPQKLLEFKGTVSESIAGTLAIEFADAFVKAYQKANQ
jgi:hypothetical protein